MIAIIEKHPIKSLLIISLLMLLPNLHTFVVTIMEARNFISAREMIEDGNWILTTMNGNARYEKPPLPTWFTAISAMVFGAKSLFALRLPAALMISFSGVVMFLFSKKLNLSKTQSLINSFILITSFYVIGIINEAPWDIYTHGFMLAGIFFLFQLFQDQNNLYRNSICAAFFVGLSIMSKGPVSFYVLFLPFIISYGIVFKFRDFKGKIGALSLFILLFALLGGWWFIYVRFADSEAFIEIATKESSRWGSYNVRPFYYYWSFFTQSGIWTIPAFIGLIYPYLIKKVQNKKLYKFSFIWSIAAVILLSIIPEKKSRYLVPILFPLAINTGFYIWYLIKNFESIKSKREKIPVYFNFGLIALIGLSFPIVGYLLLKDNLSNLWIQFIIASVAFITVGSLIIKFLVKKNIKLAFYATIGFMIVLQLFGLPLSTALYSNSDFNQITVLKEEIEPSEQIKSYTIGELTPELLWYYGSKIENIYSNEVIRIPKDDKFGVLIESDKLPLLNSISETHSISLKTKFDLNYYKKKRDRLSREYYIITKK